MFAAISNYDISWPDPTLSGADVEQKFLQCSLQYQIGQTTTNDSATFGGTYSGDYRYIGGAISKDGIIANAPYFAGVTMFIDTKNLTTSTGGSLTGYDTVNYIPWNDSFYYTGPGGIRALSAQSTGSAPATAISGAGTPTGVFGDGPNLWSVIGDSGGKWQYTDLRTNFTTKVGSTVTVNARDPIMAPNGLLVAGGGSSTMSYFDTVAGTSGTIGTVANDTCYNWVVAKDGYLYSFARNSNNNVYRLDPYKRTITVAGVYSGLGAGANVRGGFLLADGNPCAMTINGKFVKYDTQTGVVSVLPQTVSITYNSYHVSNVDVNGVIYSLNSSGTITRSSLTNSRNLLTQAYVGNQIRRANAS